MKLYLLTSTETHSRAVVAAPNEHEAARTFPLKDAKHRDVAWDKRDEKWVHRRVFHVDDRSMDPVPWWPAHAHDVETTLLAYDVESYVGQGAVALQKSDEKRER